MVMRSAGASSPSARASAADVETLAIAIVSSVRFRAASISADCAKREGGSRGSGGASAAAAVHRAQQHLLGPAACGNQPHPRLDQPDVRLRVRLPARRVQANLRAPAQRQPKRRRHHRPRAKLDGRRHLLESRESAASTSSHSPSCATISSCIRFAPTLKLSRSPVITNPAKSRTASDAGLQHRRNHRQHIAANRVLQRVQLDAPDPVAQIHQRRAGIAPHHPMRAPEIRNPRVARLRGIGSQLPVYRIEALRPVVEYHDPYSVRREDLQLRGSPAAPAPSCAQQSSVTPAASHISNGPSSQLKPACMARSIERIPGHFANAIGRIVPQRTPETATKIAPPCPLPDRSPAAAAAAPAPSPHSWPSPAPAAPAWPSAGTPRS